MNTIPNYKIVSIDGNIGSGKSTLLEKLKHQYARDKSIVFLVEPVGEWEKIKDADGNTMLKKFYTDQQKYSFAFQMMAYISRLKILRDTVKEISKKPDEHFVIITERSLYTDRYIFAKMLHDQGHIEDVCYQIYLNWFEEFANDFPINHTIYVKTDPNNCYKRIHLRARNGEEVIPLDYLDNCDRYHEDFLDPSRGITKNLLVLDGNIDIYQNNQILDVWFQNINEFMNT
jgi:deoxyadenosine/deoxycytidine kinase